jgi:tetratricopeptide (TPR) repeat protein
MLYRPIVEIVRTVCEIADGDGAATIADRLRATLVRLDVDAGLAGPLERLLGVSELDAEASPESVQVATRTAVVALLVAAARTRPLLVVIEDFQWVDSASREVVSALVQEVPAVPMAFVTTYRSGAAPDWMNRPQATQLSLPPLSRRESIELARAVVFRSAMPRGTQVASPETVNAIIEHAEGNPFFIEELALAVEESGRDPSGPLPESIVDVVRSRIFGLSGGTQRVLAIASIIGRTCPISLLEALVAGDSRLAARLDELARLDLVLLRAQGNDRVVTFRHVVTQEVAYEILSAEERRRLHGDAARALEAAHAGRHDAVIELLAYHHARGDDPARAVDALSLAVIKAVSANALDAARSDHADAVRLLDKMPSVPENRRRRIALYVGEHVVPLFFLLLQVESYLRVLDELEPEASALGDPALLGMLYARKGHCLWWIGRFDEAVAASERALGYLEPLHLPILAVHTFRANALYAKGDFAKLLALEPVTREVIARERHLRWSAYLLGTFAWSHTRMGHLERASAITEELLGLVREGVDASVTSFVHWSVALVLSDAGDSERALEHARRGVEVAPTPADRIWAESVEAVVLCRRAEDAERGTQALGPLIHELRRHRLLAVEELFVPALGEGYVRLGRFDDAIRVFDGLRARAERYEMRYLEAVACGWLAAIAERSGDPSATGYRARAERIRAELGTGRERPAAARASGIGLAVASDRIDAGGCKLGSPASGQADD